MSKLFPIGIEVEEVAVGSVLRILNKTPGVAKLHLNLMNENPSEERDGGTVLSNEMASVLPRPRPPREGSVQTVIAKMLSVAPCHNKVLREALKRNKFSETGLPSQLTVMKAKGYIQKMGPGLWRLTNRGKSYYSLGEPSPVKQGRFGPAANNGSGVRGLVLKTLSEKETLSSELKRILEKNEFSPKNLNGIVGKMRIEGLIHSAGGVYSITDQGRATFNEATAPTKENAVED